ncbi:MAG: deoxynucleoside kinase [Sandaracinaceae bacterium]|nr:deoxynucleoside kinase [Sandaracinaceae bacterium]
MSRFIVIEGLIGVGKTSLCKLVQQEWGAELVLEPADHNPFLASFYADPVRYGFATQMFYLASRYAQQVSLLQGDLFTDLIVSDYIWEKDRIFAEQTLADDELDLYERFMGLLAGRVAAPDFVLFLDAPTDVIMARIARRAISAEQQIAPRYLDELRERYYALWDRYDVAPVYVLDTTTRNYVDDPEDAAAMLRMLRGWLDGAPAPDAPPRYATGSSQLALF